jgi:polysaccharide pyruvyl transferase WcaK-like protein
MLLSESSQTSPLDEKKDLPTSASFESQLPTEPRRKEVKVCFFGHFGCGNFGNESTLQAIIYHLRRLLPDAEFTCICTGPTTTATKYNIHAVPVSRLIADSWRPSNRFGRMIRFLFIGIPSEIYRLFEAVETLKGTDLVIIPGTGLLTDAYGIWNWGPYSLFKWSMVAKILGCKLAFVSVGVGPLYGSIGRFLVKKALRLADFRSYRDSSSIQYLKSTGFTSTNDRLYPDLVFSLPEATIPHSRTEIRRRRPIVGIGLMEYAGRYSVETPSTSTYQNYLEAFLILVDWLLAQGYDVRLLIGDLCDQQVTQDFQDLLRKRLSFYDESRILDEPISSVEQLLDQIAGTELVIATRFHNALLSLLCNKPVIAVSFHHKCASLMNSIGLEEYCLDINNLKGDDLIEKVLSAEANADGIKALLESRADLFRQALDEQYELILRTCVN